MSLVICDFRGSLGSIRVPARHYPKPVAERDGHIMGTKLPKQDDKGRNRTKRPSPESPVSVEETRLSERFRNARI